MYVHMNTGVWRSKKKVFGSLGARITGSCQSFDLVAGKWFQSSARAASSLNHWEISTALKFHSSCKNNHTHTNFIIMKIWIDFKKEYNSKYAPELF